MGKRRSKRKSIIESLIAIVIVLVVGYVAQNNGNLASMLGIYNDVQTSVNIEYNNEKIYETIDLQDDKLNIVFFYVGQADCTLVKLNDSVMLIDAGNNNDGENVVSYLKQIGINKIDYLVGTHADEDHIGGLDDVIKSFEIGEIYMPKIGSEKVNYEDIIKAVNEKSLIIKNPRRGEKFTIGGSVIQSGAQCDLNIKQDNKADAQDDLNIKQDNRSDIQKSELNNSQNNGEVSQATCEIMSALNDEETSANNSSIVIEMKYKNTSYLFMGDAEKEVESSRRWNKVDILKVGHHGSNTSSSEKFLNQVSPKYAVIEVGKDNSYNLPNSKAIQRIEKVGATVLRTDENKTSFLMTSDGNSILVKEVSVDLDGNE